MFTSRSFAFSLVGIASCYLFIMICKAYQKMSEQNDEYYDLEASLTYFYDTESYDFKPYESYTDELYPTRGIHRDFEYNKSIGSSVSNIDENEQMDMRTVILNINSSFANVSQQDTNKEGKRNRRHHLRHDSDCLQGGVKPTLCKNVDHMHHHFIRYQNHQNNKLNSSFEVPAPLITIQLTNNNLINSAAS